MDFLFMEEIWKTLDGEPFYQVSNYGRIKCVSRDKWNGNVFYKTPDIIKKNGVNEDGYPSFIRVIDGKTKRTKIHRLVALAFIQNPENKKEINHIDGNKTNNHVSNLEWVTHQENIQHAYDIGLMSNKGENHPANKITESDVREIKKRLSNGEKCTHIAKDYPISMSMVSKINRGHFWKEVTI